MEIIFKKKKIWLNLSWTKNTFIKLYFEMKLHRPKMKVIWLELSGRYFLLDGVWFLKFCKAWFTFKKRTRQDSTAGCRSDLCELGRFRLLHVEYDSIILTCNLQTCRWLCFMLCQNIWCITLQHLPLITGAHSFVSIMHRDVFEIALECRCRMPSRKKPSLCIITQCITKEKTGISSDQSHCS